MGTGTSCDMVLALLQRGDTAGVLLLLPAVHALRISRRLPCLPTAPLPRLHECGDIGRQPAGHQQQLRFQPLGISLRVFEQPYTRNRNRSQLLGDHCGAGGQRLLAAPANDTGAGVSAAMLPPLWLSVCLLLRFFP